MSQPLDDANTEVDSKVPMITNTLPEAVFILIVCLGGAVILAVSALALIIYRRRRKRTHQAHAKGSAHDQTDEEGARRTSDDDRLPLTPLDSTDHIPRYLVPSKARPDSTTLPSRMSSLTRTNPTPNPSLRGSNPLLVPSSAMTSSRERLGQYASSSPEHDSWGWINEPRLDILDSYIGVATSSHESESVVSQVLVIDNRSTITQPQPSPILPSTHIRDASPLSSSAVGTFPQRPPLSLPATRMDVSSSPRIETNHAGVMEVDINPLEKEAGGSRNSTTRNKLHKKSSKSVLSVGQGDTRPERLGVSASGIQGTLKRLTPSSAALMAMAGGVSDSLVSWWETSSEDEGRRKPKKKKRRRKKDKSSAV